jgi:hypothetical protein
VHCPLITSNYFSSSARLRPPWCVTKIAREQSPISHNQGLPVHLRTSSITASKCISNSLDYSLPVRMIMASKYISRLTRLCFLGESQYSEDYGVKVYLQILSIIASKCISTLAQSLSRSASLSLFNNTLQVSVQMHSISTSKCICNPPWSRPLGVSLSSLDHQLRAHFKMLSSTACSQSWYTICRWVGI